jgi:hypothetical protein
MLITKEYIEGVAEIMGDSDYTRFPWGGDVTPEIIHAAAVVVHREADGTPDLDDSMEVEAEVLRVLNRGWTAYDDLDDLTRNDEQADELNTLLHRFEFSGIQREEADKQAGLVLLKEAADRGESVVWYNSADVPGLRLISNIVIFNKRVG